MSDKTILELLRGVSFLHDIADEHLERLAAISRKVEFPARKEVFHEHDSAEDVFLITRGRVSLVICAPKVGCRQLMEVGAGELISWSPLVARARLSDSAQTLVPTTVIAINGKAALELCAADPVFGFEFMRRAAQVLAERLAATRLQLLEMGGVRLPEVAIESD